MKLVERAKKGTIDLLFVDPAHPTHNTENGSRWQERGAKGTVRVKSNSGRTRLTILGALNPLTLIPSALLTEDNCDALMMAAFFRQLREEYPNRRKRLVLILDNARYNHAAAMAAKKLNIQLVFLPAYAPNLNLIERLWKFYRKTVKHDRYYETFQEFFDATVAFFHDIERYRPDLESLLTLKFEII
jgi:transposase